MLDQLIAWLKLICFAICIISQLSPSLTKADGCFLGYHGANPNLVLVDENAQVASIAFQNGVERMALAINIPKTDFGKGLWIVPVPAHPEQVTIKLLKHFPHLFGYDRKEKVIDLFENMAKLASLTQIYPLIPASLFRTLGASIPKAFQSYVQLSELGMKSELISASSLSGLKEFLTERGLNIPDEKLLNSFEPYMTGSWSFIVSWIDDLREFTETFENATNDRSVIKNAWPSIFIEFPSERPFFPLRASSAYGERLMKIALSITGDYEFARDSRYRNNAKVSYLERKGVGQSGVWQSQGSAQEQATRDLLNDFPPGPVPFVSIELEVKASELTEDAWFYPSSSWALSYLRLFSSAEPRSNLLVPALFLCALVSLISAGLAGLFTFRKFFPYTWFGLFNCLTVITFAIIIKKVFKKYFLASLKPQPDSQPQTAAVATSNPKPGSVSSTIATISLAPIGAIIILLIAIGVLGELTTVNLGSGIIFSIGILFLIYALRQFHRKADTISKADSMAKGMIALIICFFGLAWGGFFTDVLGGALMPCLGLAILALSVLLLLFASYNAASQPDMGQTHAPLFIFWFMVIFPLVTIGLVLVLRVPLFFL